MDLIEQLRALSDKAASPNAENISEAATRSQFVEPLLAALGFEGLVDIDWEYHIKASNERIDYVLKINGKPAVAVEAKSLGTDLVDKHAAQLVQYAAIEGMEWCLLTNGREVRIFNANLQGSLEAKHVVDLDLLDEQISEAAAILTLFSKDSLSNPGRLREWMRETLLDRALRLQLLNPGSDTIRQLAEAAARSTGFGMTAEQVSRWFARLLAPADTPAPQIEEQVASVDLGSQSAYWLLPAGSGDDGAKPEEVLRRWLGANMWGMGRSTPNRTRMQPGDGLCFYANRVGVVAHARLTARSDELVTAEEWPEPNQMGTEVFKVPLEGITWLPRPTVIDEKLRGRLDAFSDKRPSQAWSWLVQKTNKLSEHDFHILIGSA
ncbi:MAG: type I restriction enzyme HsdR N-terminal domain-containing protein [Chloroflexi bacterium]|nr:type I restriction enzyme HsdR N-terminal domain-containing protein [Chloroflexota bacterium]